MVVVNARADQIAGDAADEHVAGKVLLPGDARETHRRSPVRKRTSSSPILDTHARPRLPPRTIRSRGRRGRRRRPIEKNRPDCYRHWGARGAAYISRPHRRRRRRRWPQRRAVPLRACDRRRRVPPADTCRPRSPRMSASPASEKVTAVLRWLGPCDLVCGRTVGGEQARRKLPPWARAILRQLA